MKFPKYYTVLDETVIELETDFETTVERLQQLQGICRETDGEQRPLQFTCTKDGEMRVDNVPSRYSASADRLNFVVGEVVEEDGKTRIKFYSIHDRSTKKLRNVVWTVYALVFAVFVLFGAAALMQGARVTPKDVGTAVGFLVLLAMIQFSTARETKNQPADLEKMKAEMVNRVNAVDRWDE